MARMLPLLCFVFTTMLFWECHSFSKHPKSQTVGEGENVTLTCWSHHIKEILPNTCKTHSHKPRWMLYTKNSTTPERVANCLKVEDDFSDSMTVDINTGLKKFSLSITNAQPQDSGEYFCRIYFKSFEETYNSNIAFLTVDQRPPKHRPTCEAHEDPSRESACSTISMTCSLSPDDPPSLLTWFQSLPSGLSPLGSSDETGQSLSIQHVLHDTERPREFICIAGADFQSGPRCSVTPTVLPDYVCNCKTQGNFAGAILGAILGAVLLSIGIVLLRNLLVRNKQKQSRPRRVTNQSFALRQERPAISNPVATEAGLTYENFPEETTSQPEQTSQPEPSTESQTPDPKTDLYAIPNRRGGIIRHFTLTPQTNKATNQPGFVSLPRNMKPLISPRPKDLGNAGVVKAKPNKDTRKPYKPIPERYAPESSSSASDAASDVGSDNAATPQDHGLQEGEELNYADLNLDHSTQEGAAGMDTLYATVNTKIASTQGI